MSCPRLLLFAFQPFPVWGFWGCHFRFMIPLFCSCASDGLLADDCSASSLGMMSDEEKRHQRVEDIKDLLS